MADDFEQTVAPYRAELHAHCYRMLGSLHDADDALQDALLRAWRGIDRFQGRSSLRSWLYRIATNVSLDLIARRPKRVLPLDYDEREGPLWLEPYPAELEDASPAPDARYEQRESVELAFVAAVQHLPPNQRAALMLRDVLGFRAREAAETLDTTVESVNSALARARRTLERRLPERSQQQTLRALGDDGVRQVVERYMDAMERADVEAIVGLLSEDAVWSMPPLPESYRGEEAIRAFLHAGPLNQRWRHLPTHANGQAAVGCYILHKDRYRAAVIDVLTLDGPRISAITAFIDPRLFKPFGLPESYAA
ncbi:sigma-70 family RNA polymerase sigma factor [Candidatus Solirubrobacter pratensis]|uniref:sigma-70 family RNA polymerase sigma factor n=1 Tax=Candidatus Solirubrobacter pratensis TaxID=1298857 RepID=UPI00040F3361|nr:sigma-70 family RNA polymerase sigma factor [Candidatus Solirubrobacter pratensis]